MWRRSEVRYSIEVNVTDDFKILGAIAHMSLLPLNEARTTNNRAYTQLRIDDHGFCYALQGLLSASTNGRYEISATSRSSSGSGSGSDSMAITQTTSAIDFSRDSNAKIC